MNALQIELYIWPYRSNRTIVLYLLNKTLLEKLTKRKSLKYRAYSVITTFGQQGSALEQLEREEYTHTATHRETDYCNPAAHAQRVNKLI